MNADRALTDQLICAGRAEAAADAGPRREQAQLVRPLVERLNEADAHSIVELGCGNGWVADALDRCGFEVVGVDHDAIALRAARSRSPDIRFEAADALHMADPAWAGRFDAVVAIDLIDHVARPRALVESAIAALRPGGILVFSATFHGYAKNLLLALGGRFDARWEALRDDGRVKFFSRSTLLETVDGFGLHDVRLQTVGRIPMLARAMLLSARKPG